MRLTISRWRCFVRKGQGGARPLGTSGAGAIIVDGGTVQIIKTPGLALSEYLWAPSGKAVFGAVLVYSGLHVRTADTA